MYFQDDLIIVPLEKLHIQGNPVLDKDSEYKYTLDRAEPIRTHSFHNWRHGDKESMRPPSVYSGKTISKNQVEERLSGQGKTMKRNHQRGHVNKFQRVKEMNIINNNKDSVDLHRKSDHKDDNIKTQLAGDKLKGVGSKPQQSANRRQSSASDGKINGLGNGPNLSSSHKGVASENPKGSYKQGHVNLEVDFERQANTLYDEDQRNKAATLRRGPTSASFRGIDRKQGHNDASSSEESNDTENNNNTIPSLDIPNRFLKIPSSEKKLQSLIKEVLLRHPCIQQISRDGSETINPSERAGVEDFTDDIIKAGKRIKLCKVQQQRSDVKQPRQRGKHKRRHNKTARILHAKSHFDGTISKGKQLSWLNGTYKDSQIQLTHGREELNVSRTNWVVTSEGEETSEKGNLIRVSSPLHRQAHHKQQIASGERKEQHTNHSHKFSVVGALTNTTFKQDDAEKSSDFIIWCSGQEGNVLWARQRINGLLNRAAAPYCWHAAALREIYQLEEDLHGNSNERKGGLDSSEAMEGVSEVICYLIDEVKKCKSGGTDTNISSNSHTPTQNNGKVSTLMSTISTTTTSQKPVTSPEYEKSNENHKSKKYNLNDKLDRFDQSNYFNLDWESNMLFY